MRRPLVAGGKKNPKPMKQLRRKYATPAVRLIHAVAGSLLDDRREKMSDPVSFNRRPLVTKEKNKPRPMKQFKRR